MAHSLNGHLQVELKFRVSCLEPIRDRLLGAGGIPRFPTANPFLELDTYWDHPVFRVEARGYRILSRVRQGTGENLVVVKDSGTALSYWFSPQDIAPVEHFLENTGFKRVMRLQKRREMYVVEPFHVDLDEVEGLGRFVEIGSFTAVEGELPAMREGVDHFAGVLGLQRGWIETRSYRNLVER